MGKIPLIIENLKVNLSYRFDRTVGDQTPIEGMIPYIKKYLRKNRKPSRNLWDRRRIMRLHTPKSP